MVDFGMPKQAMVDNILVQEPLIVHEARGCTWQAAPAQAWRDCFGQILVASAWWASQKNRYQEEQWSRNLNISI